MCVDELLPCVGCLCDCERGPRSLNVPAKWCSIGCRKTFVKRNVLAGAEQFLALSALHGRIYRDVVAYGRHSAVERLHRIDTKPDCVHSCNYHNVESVYISCHMCAGMIIAYLFDIGTVYVPPIGSICLGALVSTLFYG